MIKKLGGRKQYSNLLSDRSLSRGCHAERYFFEYLSSLRFALWCKLGHAGCRLVEYANGASTASGRTQKKRESQNDGKIFLLKKPTLGLRKKRVERTKQFKSIVCSLIENHPSFSFPKTRV